LYDNGSLVTEIMFKLNNDEIHSILDVLSGGQQNS